MVPRVKEAKAQLEAQQRRSVKFVVVAIVVPLPTFGTDPPPASIPTGSAAAVKSMLPPPPLRHPLVLHVGPVEHP